MVDPYADLVDEYLAAASALEAPIVAVSRRTYRPTTSVQAGRIADEAREDHGVLKHYPTGRDLIVDFDGKQRRLPDAALPTLEAHAGPAVLRERCRLRRLRAL